MWLERTPSAVVHACAAMLPRMEAEEALMHADVTALGSGTLERQSAMRLANRLKATARGEQVPDEKADPGVLQQHGFKIRTVPVARKRGKRAKK